MCVCQAARAMDVGTLGHTFRMCLGKVLYMYGTADLQVYKTGLYCNLPDKKYVIHAVED